MAESTKKTTIAVDIDDVLFPLAPTLLEFHNSRYGTSFELSHMNSYFIQDLTGETEEQILKKFVEYLKTEHYTEGRPVEGAISAIQQLEKRNKLVLITARQSIYRGPTEQFIEEHFGGLFDELRYTHTLEEPNATISKFKICQELGAEILIDDSLFNITEASEQGVEGVLFGNYPWNQTDVLPDGVVRCEHWQGVLEYFDARS